VRRAAVILAMTRVLLAVVGLDRTRRLLTTKRACRIDAPRANALARAMLHASHRVPFATTCLDRAVALWWLLSGESIAATLRIGVRKSGDARIRAHAWVEHDGRVLLDEEAAGFAAFEAAILASE
jgi:Transglutaminase-like superfamily